MDEEKNTPVTEQILRELREVMHDLPQADDMEPNPPSIKPTVARAQRALEKLKAALVRVRWAVLAVLATALLSFGGALAANALATSEWQRWGLAMLIMALLLAAIVLLDVALQWSERAMFALVRKNEARFLAEVGRQAAQMLDEKP